MVYRREVDGLRALAVLPVLFYHAEFPAFSGGFVGVDVFFVISGYLITTLLLTDLDRGSFSVGRFYERRARRILPALFLVVTVCVPVAWLSLPPSELISFSKSVVAIALFVSNFYFWRDGGYFFSPALLKPLLHTWSLAVEEQFYLLFPVGLMLAWRKGRRWTAGMIVLAAVTSLALAQWGSVHKPIPTFFLLPTRAWELAIGALLAMRPPSERWAPANPLARELAGLIGLALIGAAVVAFHKGMPFPGVYALVPDAGTALVIMYAWPGTLCGRILGSRPLVGIGLISYSAYLWHYPLFAFTRERIGPPGTATALALIACALLLAALTWRFVERPFRATGVISRNHVVAAGLACGLLLVAAGLATTTLFDAARGSVEDMLASTLAKSPAVYASTMDERLFVKSRIRLETRQPSALVIGSSRVMQISEHSYGRSVLNLSVSGASVEDDIAIAFMAANRFEPGSILLGADPWLFNADSQNVRWHSLDSEYRSALASLNGDSSHVDPAVYVPTPGRSESALLSRAGIRLYQRVNRSGSAARDDLPGLRDKIRRDGSRVANAEYSSMSEAEIESQFGDLLVYGMAPFQFSSTKASQFAALVNHLRGSHRVALVLAPYHPKLYQRMTTEMPVVMDMEKKFRTLAAESGVAIIGSYDPAKAGCAATEFYDGMHPNEVCMSRVLSQLERR